MRRKFCGCGQRSDLLPAALDLIRYHFHYAETLLGEETLPADRRRPGGGPLGGAVAKGRPDRLVPFTYEVLDLQETGEVDLEEFTALFRPVGSVALFLRRGEQVFCESLEENFLKLLQGCDGRSSPREIFAGSIPRQEGGNRRFRRKRGVAYAGGRGWPWNQRLQPKFGDLFATPRKAACPMDLLASTNRWSASPPLPTRSFATTSGSSASFT